MSRTSDGLLVCCLLAIVLGVSAFAGKDDVGKDSRNRCWHRDTNDLGYDEAEEQNLREKGKNEFENWTGRWMPAQPGEPTPPPKVFPSNIPTELGEYKSELGLRRIQMGELSAECDDGKTNLAVDWDFSPINHTCYARKLTPNLRINPSIYCEHIPEAYVAIHKCMNEPIEYIDEIPLYGTHRPLWPVYGEYKFLPKQRWLHSLEHGAVVMLYHPCANPLEIKRLSSLVTGCIRRHIITPYNLPDQDRPLALLTWGCRLTMSYVNSSLVEEFIRKRALRGPEAVSKDGQYSAALIKKAKVVSDIDDTTLCPKR